MFVENVVALIFALPKFLKICGSSSVGRARPCQGRGRGFESRLPLKEFQAIIGLEFFLPVTFHLGKDHAGALVAEPVDAQDLKSCLQ